LLSRSLEVSKGEVVAGASGIDITFAVLVPTSAAANVLFAALKVNSAKSVTRAMAPPPEGEALQAGRGLANGTTLVNGTVAAANSTVSDGALVEGAG
jgi:hypothetical protein